MGLCYLLAITKNSDRNPHLYQSQFVTESCLVVSDFKRRSRLGTKEVTLQNVGSWRPIIGVRAFWSERFP